MTPVADGASLVKYVLKPQLRTLGPKYGKKLKAITQFLATCDGAQVVSAVRADGSYSVELDGRAENSTFTATRMASTTAVTASE